MADDKTKAEGAAKPNVSSDKSVDPESVRIEDMELTEQQLRTVSGGKGLGRVGSSFGIWKQRPTALQNEAELQKLNQTIGQ